ncbi:MAG: NAD(P)H-hydrate dehydratase [Clostridia bacterium]|nr:NAD(P)H-hydrate dehydratase [Clostridia bacterium]
MYVVTPSEMRKIDQRAIEEFQIPGIVLMENAALQTVQIILKHYPIPSNVLVLAGCGNNGGDALAVARHLFLEGYHTEVVIVGEDGRRPKGDADTNLKILESLHANFLSEIPQKSLMSNTPQNSFVPHNNFLNIHWLQKGEDLNRFFPLLKDADFVVEGFFGTGLDRPITGLHKDIIDLVFSIPIISIDIPSGINGKTGQIMGTAFRAAHTVSYGYLKTGHLLYPGRECSGEIHVVPISLPADSPQSAGGRQFTLTDRETAQMLKPRPRNSHKGNFGKVAVIAGSTGLTGAAYLTSLAAQRTGAGLVTLGIPRSLNPVMEQKLTEVMTFPIEDRGEGQLVTESLSVVTELLKDKDVLAIGPGCGKSSGVFEILWNILGKIDISIVIDADGLNHISKDMSLIKSHKAPVILTPHPGELSRMTGWAVEDILDRPVEAASRTAEEYACIVLLKGAASIVAEPRGRIYINTSGNSGMAKGGSGDVLTGMIASLLAQGYCPYEAAVLACYTHGRAGDEAAEKLGETGMIAKDIIEAIPEVFKRLYSYKSQNRNS